jgi:inorganic phosphate transporter, PiT family
MGTDVTELFVVITAIAVALVFDYTNGFHDSANAMAGPIATGALRPRTAVILAAILNLVGACLATEVAKTISGGFFDETLITVPIILAGLVGAIIWNLMTWLLGLPSSSSHALFGGLIGAVIVGAGLASVHGWVIVSKVLLPAIVAPLVAGVAAVTATLVYRISRRTPSAHTNSGYKYGQAFTASLVALAHGTSDGQKTMGVITLVLIAANLQEPGTGPQWWVIIAAGIAIGLGTYSGGWRIMRTMGKGIVEIETPQGAASGAATTATILASAHFGFGLSTTHVSTGSILGSGVGRDGAEVRWSVARRMLFAWLLTLPGAALVAGLAALLSDQGAFGVMALLTLLGAACLVIYLLSRRHRVSHANVTDSHEVLVLAAAAPPATYPNDPRLDSPKPKKTKKAKKAKAKSAA